MERESTKMTVTSQEDSGQLYRSILENIDDRVFAKDTRGRYIYLNRASCEFWGISPDTVLGKTDWEISQILGISAKTVNFHVENVKRKYGVTTRIQAIVAGLRDGTFDL